MLRCINKLVLTAGLFVACASAHAQVILFTESFVGSGSLDGVAFTNQTISFQGFTALSQVVNNGGGFYSASIPQPFTGVTVGNLTDKMLDSILFYNTQPNTSVGLYDLTTGAFIATSNPSLSTYTLSTPINLTGPAVLGPGNGNNLQTANGHLVITGLTPTSHFTAQFAMVPEPGVNAMLAGMGVTGLMVAKRRLRRKSVRA